MKLKKKLNNLQKLVDRLLVALYVMIVLTTLVAFIFVGEFIKMWIG